jgi:hypothetical protein
MPHEGVKDSELDKKRTERMKLQEEADRAAAETVGKQLKEFEERQAELGDELLQGNDDDELEQSAPLTELAEKVDSLRPSSSGAGSAIRSVRAVLESRGLNEDTGSSAGEDP